MATIPSLNSLTSGYTFTSDYLVIDHNGTTYKTTPADLLKTIPWFVGGSQVASITSNVSAVANTVNMLFNDTGIQYTGASNNLLLSIPRVNNSVNYPVLSASTTGNAVSLTAAGTDANIDFNVVTPGTGALKNNGNVVATQAWVNSNTNNFATQSWVGANYTTSTNATTQLNNAIGNLSYRNKVRNGRMDIWQRGTSLAGVTSTQYTADGWVYAVAGSPTAVVTVSQGGQFTSNEFQNSFKVTVTTADTSVTAGKIVGILQPIEGYLVRDLVGVPVAIRFDVKSPKAGQHYVALRNSASDRSYVLPYTITTANTGQTVTLTIPAGLVTDGTWNWTTGVGVSLTFPLIAGSSFQTASTGSWQTGNFVAGTGQQNLLDTVGNVFAITGVQLERGSASTTFEHRSFTDEMVFNQRYFELAGFQSYYVAGNAGSVMYVPVYFRTTKRATPTITLPSSTNAVYNSAGTNVTPTTWGLASYDSSGFGINAQNTSGGISGVVPGVATASAEL